MITEVVITNTVAAKIAELKSKISLKLRDRQAVLIMVHSIIMILLVLISSKNAYIIALARITDMRAVVFRLRI